MKRISQKNIFDLFYIIYNFPFLLCLEILYYGGFAIAKYDSYKKKYIGIEESDQKNFRMITTVVSTLIYMVIFLLIGALNENK